VFFIKGVIFNPTGSLDSKTISLQRILSPSEGAGLVQSDDVIVVILISGRSGCTRLVHPRALGGGLASFGVRVLPLGAARRRRCRAGRRPFIRLLIRVNDHDVIVLGWNCRVEDSSVNGGGGGCINGYKLAFYVNRRLKQLVAITVLIKFKQSVLIKRVLVFLQIYNL